MQSQHASGGRVGSRLSLVLDLDECLIRAQEVKPDNQDGVISSLSSSSFIVKLETGATFVICKRPGLDNFLERVCDDPDSGIDTYIFTASEEVYGYAIIRALDPDGSRFSGVYYRQSCIRMTESIFVKDLQAIVEDLSRVVLVDDNPLSFLANPDNGILVKSFYGDPNDHELVRMLPWIQELADTTGDLVRTLKRLSGPLLQTKIRRCLSFTLQKHPSSKPRNDWEGRMQIKIREGWGIVEPGVTTL